MHAPGLQGMPNDTRISCCPANVTPLHFCWACSASSAELMSTKANPREDPEGAVSATWGGGCGGCGDGCGGDGGGGVVS